MSGNVDEVGGNDCPVCDVLDFSGSKWDVCPPETEYLETLTCNGDEGRGSGGNGTMGGDSATGVTDGSGTPLARGLLDLSSVTSINACMPDSTVLPICCIISSGLTVGCGSCGAGCDGIGTGGVWTGGTVGG